MRGDRDAYGKGGPVIADAPLTLPRPEAAPSLPHEGGGKNASLVPVKLQRVGAVRAQPHLAVLDVRDEADRDVVVLGALPVLRLRRVVLGQLDAVALDVVDGADMGAVGADDLGMLLDLRNVDHVQGDRIKLTKNDSPQTEDGQGAKHHYISIGLVADIEDGKVRLSSTGANTQFLEEDA